MPTVSTRSGKLVKFKCIRIALKVTFRFVVEPIKEPRGFIRNPQVKTRFHPL